MFKFLEKEIEKTQTSISESTNADKNKDVGAKIGEENTNMAKISETDEKNETDIETVKNENLCDTKVEVTSSEEREASSEKDGEAISEKDKATDDIDRSNAEVGGVSTEVVGATTDGAITSSAKTANSTNIREALIEGNTALDEPLEDGEIEDTDDDTVMMSADEKEEKCNRRKSREDKKRKSHSRKSKDGNEKKKTVELTSEEKSKVRIVAGTDSEISNNEKMEETVIKTKSIENEENDEKTAKETSKNNDNIDTNSVSKDFAKPDSTEIMSTYKTAPEMKQNLPDVFSRIRLEAVEGKSVDISK